MVDIAADISTEATYGTHDPICLQKQTIKSAVIKKIRKWLKHTKMHSISAEVLHKIKVSFCEFVNYSHSIHHSLLFTMFSPGDPCPHIYKIITVKEKQCNKLVTICGLK